MCNPECTIVLTSWQCWGMQKKERLRCWICGVGWDWGWEVAPPNKKCYHITMPHMSRISIYQIKQPETPQWLCIQADVQFQPYFIPNYHIIIIALLRGCCVVNLVYSALRGVVDMVLADRLSAYPSVRLSVHPSIQKDKQKEKEPEKKKEKVIQMIETKTPADDCGLWLRCLGAVKSESSPSFRQPRGLNHFIASKTHASRWNITFLKVHLVLGKF